MWCRHISTALPRGPSEPNYSPAILKKFCLLCRSSWVNVITWYKILYDYSMENWSYPITSRTCTCISRFCALLPVAAHC